MIKIKISQLDILTTTEKTYIDSNDTTLATAIQQNADNISTNSNDISTHTHVEANITDLDKYSQSEVDSALATKAPSSHTHVEANITDLDKYTQSQVDTALAAKANSSHTHAESEITDLETDLGNLATAISGKADSSHSHVISDTTNLQTTLDGKASSSHTHVEANITDLDKYTQSQVDTALAAKANSSHIHAESEITDLETDLGNLATAISGKADSSHTHVEANITDLDKYTQSQVDTALAAKANSSHSHVISDTTNLQTTLDGKASSSHNHNLADLTEKSYNSLTDKPTIPSDVYPDSSGKLWEYAILQDSLYFEPQNWFSGQSGLGELWFTHALPSELSDGRKLHIDQFRWSIGAGDSSNRITGSSAQAITISSPTIATFFLEITKNYYSSTTYTRTLTSTYIANDSWDNLKIYLSANCASSNVLKLYSVQYRYWYE